MRDFGSRILKRARKTTPDCKTKQKHAISNRFCHGVLLGDGLATGRRTLPSDGTINPSTVQLLGQSHLKPAKTINHGSGWGNHRFKGLNNWFGNVCVIQLFQHPGDKHTTLGPRLGCCCLTYLPRPSKAPQSHSCLILFVISVITT